MKKWIVVAILGMLLLGVFPQVASAASTLYIDITATGSEITITTNCTVWAIGTVSASENKATAFNYCNVTNGTSQAVYVTVHGNEMVDVATGAAEVWTIDSTGGTFGAMGANNFALRVGVDDTTDNWDIIVREHDDGAFNELAFDVSDNTLAASDCWTFGFCFWAPQSSVGNSAMVMSNDAGTSHAQGDADNGVTLIATV